MSDSADDFNKKAVELREKGRLDEAIIAARKATTLDQADPNAWWQLALSLDRKEGATAALDFFKKTVELSPSFAYGWHRLGIAYAETSQLDHAVESWEEALKVSHERYDSMTQLLTVYSARNDEADEERIFELLVLLNEEDKLETEDINRLGIAYYSRKDYYKAIACWTRYAYRSDGPHGFFNLGLAFQNKQIGRYIDAVDSWRRALIVDPTHEGAKRSISARLPELLDLKSRIRSGCHELLGKDQWYSHYINPFELLQLNDVDPLALDVKRVQKAKKLLLQEIDLEDGHIEWMPGLVIDRSRALTIVDELENDIVRHYHYFTYQNRELLDFLSKGKLDHFLVDESLSPIEFIEKVEDIHGDFAPWLSKYFSVQYDSVLTKALEGEFSDESECLIGGRLWVTPEDEEKCYQGTKRLIDRMLQPLREASQKSEKEKPTLEKITALFNSSLATRLLARLPLTFLPEKTEAAALLRGISIDVYNHHDDPDLALSILSLSSGVASTVPSLLAQIESDVSTLKDRIKAARKDEAFLTIGDSRYNITREGVTFGNTNILASEAETIRWGVYISNVGNVRSYSFSMVVGGSGATVAEMTWSTSKNIPEQEKLFDGLVNAAFAYLLPSIHGKIQQRIDQGESVRIGPTSVTKEGVLLTVEGWFSNHDEICPWSRLKADLSNGDLVLTDSANRKARSSMALKDTDNAFVLYIMAK